jgi:hypothetical protein
VTSEDASGRNGGPEVACYNATCPRASFFVLVLW